MKRAAFEPARSTLARRASLSAIPWTILMLCAIAGLMVAARPAHAQDAGQRVGQLEITGTDAATFPSVELQVYGVDGQGNPIDFSTEELFVSHGGVPADVVTFQGKKPVGTLTVFLLDLPPGVSDQLPAIQNAITAYAGPGNMQEQVDSVAVYQIGTDGPRELLAATSFYNSVRNLFVSPLTPESGQTALFDSTVKLLELAPSLAPDPAVPVQVVVMSDGTDAVSTQYQATDVPRKAVEIGIPVHTVVVPNAELGEAGTSLGTQFLRDLATGSGGVAAQLDAPDTLTAIWNRISSFRDQAIIRYTVPQPASGTFPVELTLPNQPGLKAATEITVAGTLPSVVLNLPFESRTMTVPSLEEPIDLRLSTTVSWLDGQEREVTEAGLLVNNVRVADIPPDQLADFTVPVSNLLYGDNTLEVVVKDDQGLEASSGPTTLAVTEGDLAVPEALQPEGMPVWASVLLLLLGLVLIIGAGTLIWRSLRGGQPSTAAERSRQRRNRQPATVDQPTMGAPAAAAIGATGADFHTGQFIMAHLEVIESQTLMPEDINLGEMEVRLGRSPTQVDVAFRDDITVSRYHAVLRLDVNRYRIYDAGSTSGTYVNDRRVPDYGLELNDGDIIQMGAVRLRYRQL